MYLGGFILLINLTYSSSISWEKFMSIAVIREKMVIRQANNRRLGNFVKPIGKQVQKP